MSLTLHAQQYLLLNIFGRTKRERSTHVAFAKTNDPPAIATPLHAHPIPNVHAIVLSSLLAVQFSIFSLNHLSPSPVTLFTRPQMLVEGGGR